MASLCRNVSLFKRSGSKCLIGWNAIQDPHLVRLQSTDAKRTPFEKLDLTFTDTKEAYKSKRTSELIRACLVLKLSSFDFLVQNHEKVIN